MRKSQKGGLVDEDRNRLADIGFSEEDINYLFEHNPNMAIDFFENAVNPSGNNPFFPEPQTPAQIMVSIRENDAQDFGPDETELDEGVTDNEFSQSYGGRKKRRTKRRRTNKRRTNKRRTNKRRTNKYSSKQ